MINNHLLISAGIFAGVLVIGYLVERYLLHLLLKLTQKTETRIDDIVITSSRKPVFFWVVLLGVYLSTNYYPLADKYNRIINRLLLILFVFTLFVVIAKIIGLIIREYESKATQKLKVTSLTQNIVNLFFFLIGFLIILNILGVSIAPILTALGVGGLAIGLALQETLSNLFSGIYLILAKQTNVGDYIKLSSGEEGVVQDIGWRVTRLKTLSNNIVIIPNLKFSQSIVTNFYEQDKEMSVVIELGAAYGSDLDRLEKINIEVAKQVLSNIPGAVQNFEPCVRFAAFGESAIDMSVILRVKEFTDQYLVKHEFIKALSERYKKEGLEIPYPTRTVHVIK